jgi:hypothetical protein
MKKRATIYWLIPAKVERELFCEIIRILGKQFDAPKFQPHLTLFLTDQKGQSPGTLLRQLHSGPVRLSVRGIAFSPKFTKTLFVRFKSARPLRKLVTDLGYGARPQPKAPRDPHLSLLYKKIPSLAKKRLASIIKLPLQEVVFDSIAAVQCRLPVRSEDDVKAWKIVATKSLRR